MNRLNLTILTCALFFWGCKSYYNETINWIDSIKVGSSVASVKQDVPNYFTVAWDEPDTTLTGTVWFEVNWISGNRDVLGMANYLEFENGEFRGRVAKK